MVDNTTIPAIVEAIRGMLRTLPTDDDRARVLYLLGSPPAEGDTRKRIEEALHAAGTVVGAARLLGVGKRTLQDRMRELGFEKRAVGRKRKLA